MRVRPRLLVRAAGEARDFETGATYTEYIMRCQWGPTFERMQPWMVARRFREFSALDANLKEAFPELAERFPRLPGKSWFGSLSAEVVESRHRELEAYVVALCGTCPRASDAVDVFLMLRERTARSQSAAAAARPAAAARSTRTRASARPGRAPVGRRLRGAAAARRRGRGGAGGRRVGRRAPAVRARGHAAPRGREAPVRIGRCSTARASRARGLRARARPAADAWGPGARVDPALRRLVAQCVLSGPARAGSGTRS